MRLVGYYLDDYKGVRGYVPLTAPVTVLFGPNSAGKTNVLEALSAVAGHIDREAVRTDRGDWGDPWIDGQLLVSFDDADVPGHPDGEMLRRLLNFELAEELMNVGFVDEELMPEVRGSSIADARALLVDAMVDAGSSGGLDVRRTFAQAVAESPFVLFGWEDTHLCALRDALSDEAASAAMQIADSDDENDGLVAVARSIRDDELAFVEPVADGAHIFTKDLSPFLPRPRRLADDPAVLEAALTSHLDFVVQSRRYDATNIVSERDLWGSDGWIERQDDDDDVERLATTLHLPKNPQWMRISPEYFEAADELTQLIRSNAPSFLLDVGDPVVLPVPPDLWSVHGSRLFVGVNEADSTRDLRVLGEGVQRWFAIAAALAMYEQRRGAIELQHETYRRAESEEQLSLRRAPTEPMDVRPPVWVLDEPEAHLHLGAVRSVTHWLADLGRRSTGVIVASHHPMLLEMRAEIVTLVRVARSATGSDVAPIPHLSIDVLDTLSAQIGLRRTDLLALMRLAVFVEGPHDRAVLDAFFGDEFAAEGIKLFALHGIDNAIALADSEIVMSLDVPIAVIADNGASAASKSRPSREDAALARFVQEMRAQRRGFLTVALEKPDILEYLDEEICRLEAPAFPGWPAAVSAWRSAGKPGPVKEFITRSYGLNLDRDSVYRLALAAAAKGPVPPDLRRAADTLLAHASRDGT